jgi:hypothetical protein
MKEIRMKFRARFVGKALLGICALAVLGWVVMTLWNAIIPGVFVGVRAVDYRQALGLLVLSRLLFGGFRGRGGFSGGRRWQRRLEGMTPEERANLRDRLGGADGRGEQYP